jgi:hypothetical protein
LDGLPYLSNFGCLPGRAGGTPYGLAKLEQELKGRSQTAADLVPGLFGDLYNDEIVFALGEVIAQLHYLVEQGRAKRIARNGRVIFACA